MGLVAVDILTSVSCTWRLPGRGRTELEHRKRPASLENQLQRWRTRTRNVTRRDPTGPRHGWRNLLRTPLGIHSFRRSTTTTTAKALGRAVVDAAMALNAVMLSADGKPVPLPREKVFQSVPKVTINLSPTQPGAPTTSASSATDKGKAPATGSPTLGSVYVTNQRIVFVASNALALPTPSSNPAASQPSLDDIRTLTVPLTHHQDGRFVQPWFSANAHECNFVPVRGGGLDQLLPRGTTTFALKISFNEGGGFEFHEAVEEVKRRLHDAEGRARAGAEAESLRASDFACFRLT